MARQSKTHRLHTDGARWWCACGAWSFSGKITHHVGPHASALHRASARMSHDMHRRGMDQRQPLTNMGPLQ